MKNDNYHLGQLNWPVSQIDIQRNMVGFVVDGHIYYAVLDNGFPCPGIHRLS